MAAQRAVLSPRVTIHDLIPSFRLSLEAQNKSPKTVKSYLEAVGLLADYLTRQGMPQEMGYIKREHVEAFIADQLERWRPATAACAESLAA